MKLKRPYVLCLTGVEKNYIEKDLLKLMRRYVSDIGETKEAPLDSIHKKRGQIFAFLSFLTAEDKQIFRDLLIAQVLPPVQATGKRMKVNECNNLKKLDNINFRAVRSADTMLTESKLKKSEQIANVTEEDVLAEMADSIEDRVTPYAKYTYDE